MALNPMYVLVRNYRRILLESAAPDWHALGWTTPPPSSCFWPDTPGSANFADLSPI